MSEGREYVLETLVVLIALGCSMLFSDTLDAKGHVSVCVCVCVSSLPSVDANLHMSQPNLGILLGHASALGNV